MTKDTSSKTKNMFIGLLHRKQHIPRSGTEHTKRVWKILLIGAPLLILLILGWSVYLFTGISRESIFNVPLQSPEISRTIDQEEMRATLDFFEARAQQFEILQTSPPETVDPAR